MDSLLRDGKHFTSIRKDKQKSGSNSHSPFGSFNDQTAAHYPIDDYGRTWTSATLAAPCDNEFQQITEDKNLK